MNVFLIIAIILVLAGIAYRMGTQRALAVAGDGAGRTLHSRPGYYGTYLALWCGLPAGFVLALWMVAEPFLIQQIIVGELPQDVQVLEGDAFDLMMTTIGILAQGGPQPSNVQPFMLDAADRMNGLASIGRWAMFVVMLCVAIVGIAYARRTIVPRLRARNRVEQVIKYVLITCSCVAIFTTIGIVLSVLFESLHFFSMIPPLDFFTGTIWDPGFPREGADNTLNDFGLLPLLWGTVYIAFVAMLVAAPIGLMAAVYLSEYARGRVRAVAKPLLEILAGIPTVVYGFFALITVGPALREFGLMIGLDIQASSVLTAGLVMGIMIIPFVSSLSDDIISQVPQALRDGSYGMGATRSETIRKVIFPAALPGIVGGLLLAVSRAFGETMIVVMAVGAAANLEWSPFESMTTVTVMIVKQLTGDTEFSSPQTLVAFALGLTLFAITLCLNVVALYIVRKYREQYE